jgi:hypothetical protein
VYATTTGSHVHGPERWISLSDHHDTYLVAMNIFRLLGDLAHMSSKGILIWSIHRNKSAEGK